MLDLHFKTTLVDSWMDWKGQDDVVKSVQEERKCEYGRGHGEHLYLEGRLMSV